MDIAYKIFIPVLPELIEKLVWCFLTAIFVGTGATNIFSANTRYYQSNYSTDFISWNQNLIAFEEHQCKWVLTLLISNEILISL